MDLVTFTEEMLNGKVHLLCSVLTVDVIVFHTAFALPRKMFRRPGRDLLLTFLEEGGARKTKSKVFC